MAEKKANESNGRTNGVMITVYMESPMTPSRKLSDPVGKKKPRSQFRRLGASESQGYDRRAQLLAYARDLRNTKPQPQADEVPLPRHKSKKSSVILIKISISSTEMHAINRHLTFCIDILGFWF